MNHSTQRIHLLLTAVALSACTSSTAPSHDVNSSAYVQGLSSALPAISVSVAPRVGQSFQVVVRSFGLSGCWSSDKTVVDASSTGAVITPYNRNNVNAAYGCTQAIIAIPHTATLSFASEGAKQIVLRGREMSSGKVVQLDTTIVVTP